MHKSKPCGSVAILILLIFIFWPGAIIYACLRSWSHNHIEPHCNYNNNYYPPIKTQEEKLKEAFTNHAISAQEYEQKLKELNKKRENND